MIAEFSIVPLSGEEGVSLSKKVAQAIRIVEESGLPYQLTPMGTIVEGPWDKVMQTIQNAHQFLKSSHPRVLTRISIDDRDGSESRMAQKVESVKKHLQEQAEL